MTKNSDDSADAHRKDTLPPPASGDAYSAETAVREVPPDVLDAIRRARRAGQIETPALTDLVKSASPTVLQPAQLPRINSDDDVDDQARTRVRGGPRAPIRSSPMILEPPPVEGDARTETPPPPVRWSSPPLVEDTTSPNAFRRQIAAVVVAASAVLLIVLIVVVYHYSGHETLPPAR